ncbi:MAG: hypothetical protein U0263_21930 [Polyangiaceae bacterium]
MGMRPLAVAVCLTCLAAEGQAREGEPKHDLAEAEWKPGASAVGPADEAPPKERDPAALDPRKRALHTAIAVGPGAIVHGVGHASAGRSDTARRLALTQVVGLGTMVGGLAGLALTGASRWFAGPLALGVVAGGGLFVLPWTADIYGSAAGPEGAGRAPAHAPLVVTEFGHRYVYDPQFRYRHFLVESVDLRLDRFRVTPSGWFALDDRNARLRVFGSYRLLGNDTHFLGLEAAVTHHRFDSDGFRVLTGEVGVGGRGDLERWDGALSGAFVEGGAGLALQRFEYRVPGMDIDPEVNDLLLARYAFGFYLGRDSGEARVYYDHRHDDFAAGLLVPGLGSGVAGHFGADVRWYFGDFGVLTEAQVGSAWVTGLSLIYRRGANR